MNDAAYYRAWRAAHPEYRRRESERSRRRRLAGARGDRSAEYARQRERRAEQRRLRSADNGSVQQDHPILDAARAIAAPLVRPDRRALLNRPTWEDAVAEAAAAIVAGEDAREAVQFYLRGERAWMRLTAPLLDQLIAA